MSWLWIRLRNYWETGVAVLLPVLVTWYIVQWLWDLADNLLVAPLHLIWPEPPRGLGVLLALGMVLVTGWLTTNLLGRRLIAFAERLHLRTPVVRSLYAVTKQLFAGLFGKERAAFQQVVLVEFPHSGSYSFGFLTNRLGEGDRAVVTVFVPTTPNPTGGYVLVLPVDAVQLLSLSVEEGLKLVLSGGSFSPAPALASEIAAAAQHLARRRR